VFSRDERVEYGEALIEVAARATVSHLFGNPLDKTWVDVGDDWIRSGARGRWSGLDQHLAIALEVGRAGAHRYLDDLGLRPTDTQPAAIDHPNGVNPEQAREDAVKIMGDPTVWEATMALAERLDRQPDLNRAEIIGVLSRFPLHDVRPAKEAVVPAKAAEKSRYGPNGCSLPTTPPTRTGSRSTWMTLCARPTRRRGPAGWAAAPGRARRRCASGWAGCAQEPAAPGSSKPARARGPHRPRHPVPPRRRVGRPCGSRPLCARSRRDPS
jgi:hypothetical protein